MGFRYMTGGESHGKGLVALIGGVPSGLALEKDDIDRDLARRQAGYGRGGRMNIESDSAEIISGVRLGETTGSPIALFIENRDHQNWLDIMSVGAGEERDTGSGVTRPRPGHGDLAGMLKMGSHDARDILERASARETAGRVALGGVCRKLLGELGIEVGSHVLAVGTIEAVIPADLSPNDMRRADESPMRCLDGEAEERMRKEIEDAREDGDTLGGVFEVMVFGAPPGIGSCADPRDRLDGELCGAISSIPGIKGVEVGEGFGLAGKVGSIAHDEIFYREGRGYYRETNRAGGLEAGITNGETVVLRAAMKPIPTLGKPLKTVDVISKEAASAQRERADVCAVPSAAVVGEAEVMLVMTGSILEKFGGDSMVELRRNYDGYLEQVRRH